MSEEEAMTKHFSLEYVIDAYKRRISAGDNWTDEGPFFTKFSAYQIIWSDTWNLSRSS